MLIISFCDIVISALHGPRKKIIVFLTLLLKSHSFSAMPDIFGRMWCYEIAVGHLYIDTTTLRNWFGFQRWPVRLNVNVTGLIFLWGCPCVLWNYDRNDLEFAVFELLNLTVISICPTQYSVLEKLSLGLITLLFGILST